MKNEQSTPHVMKTANPSKEPSLSTSVPNVADRPRKPIIRIIDTDTEWLTFLTKTLVKAGHEVVGIGGDVALVSELYVGSVPDGMPFAVFTHEAPDFKTTLRMYRMGASDCLPKDFSNGAAIVKVVQDLIDLRELVPA